MLATRTFLLSFVSFRLSKILNKLKQKMICLTWKISAVQRSIKKTSQDESVFRFTKCFYSHCLIWSSQQVEKESKMSFIFSILQTRKQKWPGQWIPFLKSHNQKVAELVLRLSLLTVIQCLPRTQCYLASVKKFKDYFIESASPIEMVFYLKKTLSSNIRIYSKGI